MRSYRSVGSVTVFDDSPLQAWSKRKGCASLGMTDSLNSLRVRKIPVTAPRIAPGGTAPDLH
eukprot:311527-Lingulodinium_polyedra.AAC.1